MNLTIQSNILNVEYLDILKMKIIWKYDTEQIKKDYARVFKDLKSGFFQKNRFYVIPYLPTKFRDRVVFLPNVDKLDSVLKKYKSNFEQRIPSIKKNFKKYEKKFLVVCEKIFKELDITIEISPSFIGSVGDYKLLKKKIILFPRFDRNVFEIYCLILTALIEKDYPENLSVKEWKEKQIKTVKLFKSKEYSEIFPEIKDMIEIIDENTAGTIALESLKYLETLGYPIISYIDKVDDIKNLTKAESSLLQLFIDKKNQVLTYDEIASTLWKDKYIEKFSLYSISKKIERLRIKTMRSGIPYNLFQSTRGKGYVLYD